MRLSICRNVLVSLVLAVCLIGPALSQEPAAPPANDVNAPAARPANDANAPAAQTPASQDEPAQFLPRGSRTGGSSVRRVPGVSGGQQGPVTELQRRLKTRISVDFREAPIEDVLKSFAEQANIDVVKSPAVTGKVTATLTDVPLDEAMDGILAVHGYGYMTTESVVRVVPQAQLEKYQVHLVRRVYRIDYAELDSLQRAVKDLLSSKGKIAMNNDTRDLYIMDTDDQIAMFDKVIEDMDREVPQILVEAKIYDVSCSAYLDFGFDWFAGTATVYDAETGLAVGGKTEPFTRTNFGSSVSQATKGDFGMRLGVLNDSVDIDTTFRAVKDTVKARLLASPKILVLNGKEANIKIVSEIPYQELTQTSGGGNIGTTKFKDVGVSLLVTPNVARDNKIKLKVHPMFSVQSGSVTIQVPSGFSSVTMPEPIVDTREATTQALISDGQTVVLGGLRKKDVQRETSKVPLLGDVPILGELFKFHGDKTINSELIVFITPRVIIAPALSPSDARKLDLMESELTEPDAPEPTQECSKPGAAEEAADEAAAVKAAQPEAKKESQGKKESNDLYFPPGNW
jgi:type IV pilus assembly protein PilQ